MKVIMKITLWAKFIEYLENLLKKTHIFRTFTITMEQNFEKLVKKVSEKFHLSEKSWKSYTMGHIFQKFRFLNHSGLFSVTMGKIIKNCSKMWNKNSIYCKSNRKNALWAEFGEYLKYFNMYFLDIYDHYGSKSWEIDQNFV